MVSPEKIREQIDYEYAILNGIEDDNTDRWYYHWLEKNILRWYMPEEVDAYRYVYGGD